jgi:hypothetical protein
MSSRGNSKITLPKQFENELRSTTSITGYPTPRNSTKKRPVMRNLISRDLHNRSIQLQGKLPPISDVDVTRALTRAQIKDHILPEAFASSKKRGTSDFAAKNIRIKKPV